MKNRPELILLVLAAALLLLLAAGVFSNYNANPISGALDDAESELSMGDQVFLQYPSHSAPAWANL